MNVHFGRKLDEVFVTAKPTAPFSYAGIRFDSQRLRIRSTGE